MWRTVRLVAQDYSRVTRLRNPAFHMSDKSATCRSARLSRRADPVPKLGNTSNRNLAFDRVT